MRSIHRLAATGRPRPAARFSPVRAVSQAHGPHPADELTDHRDLGGAGALARALQRVVSPLQPRACLEGHVLDPGRRGAPRAQVLPVRRLARHRRDAPDGRVAQIRAALLGDLALAATLAARVLRGRAADGACSSATAAAPRRPSPRRLTPRCQGACSARIPCSLTRRRSGRGRTASSAIPRARARAPRRKRLGPALAGVRPQRLARNATGVDVHSNLGGILAHREAPFSLWLWQPFCRNESMLTHGLSARGLPIRSRGCPNLRRR